MYATLLNLAWIALGVTTFNIAFNSARRLGLLLHIGE
jgi:hypothetical protein